MVRIDNFSKLLVSRFSEFLSAYDQHCPFKKLGQLEYHVETIEQRRTLGSARAAVKSEAFLRNLYRTLRAWGIGSRASILKPFPVFAEAIEARASEIDALDGIAIDQPSLDVGDVSRRIGELTQRLEIVDNKARIVPGSKALHHILPDLIVPFDREYTQQFFRWQTPRIQGDPEGCAREAFQWFVMVARRANPGQYVTNQGWYTSRTKVIDNAIVGMWCWARHRPKPEAAG